MLKLYLFWIILHRKFHVKFHLLSECVFVENGMPFLHTFTHLLCNSVPKCVILFKATVYVNQIKSKSGPWQLEITYIGQCPPHTQMYLYLQSFWPAFSQYQDRKGWFNQSCEAEISIFSWGLSIVSAVSPNLCVCMQYSLISQIMRSFLLHEYCFFERSLELTM